MIQKLNNDQLQQLYFESSIPSKSFHEREDSTKMNQSNKSFFDTNVNYDKYSDEEINRYENFFNTHVYPAVHSLDEEKEAPHLSQLEKDLLEQDEINSTAQNKAIPTESINADDDLTYLNALVNNDASDINSLDSNSLTDIFAEIVNNEEESISNYESSVFDANVQMLFGEVPETGFPPVPEMPSTRNLEPLLESTESTPAVTEIPTLDFDFPHIPEPPIEEIPTPSFEMPTIPPIGENLKDLSKSTLDEIEIPIPSFEMPIPPIDENPKDLSKSTLDEIEIPTPSFEMPIPPIDENPKDLSKSTSDFEMPIIPPVIPPVDENPKDLLKSTSDFEMPIPPVIPPIDENSKDLLKRAPDEIEIPMSNFEMPATAPASESPKDLFKSTSDEIEIPMLSEAAEVGNQEFVEAAIEDFVPEQKEKKKSSKLGILDTILVLIILIIVSVLVWNYRHLLPFELPF